MRPFERLAVLCVLAASPSCAADLRLKTAEIPAPIATDPFHPAWQKAEAVKVPLMPQTIAPPGGGGAVRSLRIQALRCRMEIFLRLEWEDAKADAYPSPAEGFSDAVAVEFPAQPGTWPSPFMGDKDNAVVIWRWSASAQKDWDEGYQTSRLHRQEMTADLYTFADDDTFRAGEGVGNILSMRRRQSPVENLAAKGFGTLTALDEQPVSGRGVWREGRWHVVFRRDLNGTPSFWRGTEIPFAVAAWDGGSKERDGMKAVSVWHTLALPGGSTAADGGSREAPGRRVFLRYGCFTCHGRDALGGVPNPNAQTNPIPALNRVKEGFTKQELQTVIFKGREPARADPGGAPPPYKMNAWEIVMSQEEADALAEYLFGLMPKEGQEW